MVAHIIPLRRTGSIHDWFTYRLPEGMDVQPGQQVAIPFLRQTVTGLVWDTGLPPTHLKRLKTIKAVLNQASLISAWQQHTINTVAAQTLTPISLLVNRIIPETSTRTPTIATTTKFHPLTPLPKSTDPKVWWYRDRLAVRQRIAEWISTRSIQPRLVLVPTIEEALVIAEIAGDSTVACITSKTTPADYRQAYLDILEGKVSQIIGTQRAIFLPFSSPPEILIDQEEHPAHKQLRQYPKLDISRLVPSLGCPWLITSPAPSVEFTYRHQTVLDEAPPTAGRQLLRLDQPRSVPWITPELETILTDRLANQSVALIVPNRDFAQSVTCTDCGWQLACLYCQRILGLKRSSQDRVECAFCHHVTPLTTHCPRCQSVSWRFSGLGLRRMSEELPSAFPTINFSTSWPPIGQAAVWIGTYQLYQQLPRRDDWRAIAILSGDSLRAWPDFSADERAWQYLARLQSYAPTTPIVVQTFHHQDPFWQRWLHADERAWYRAEFQNRESLHLPPNFAEWILTPRSAKAKIENCTSWLNTLSDITTEVLPSRGRLPKRILVRSKRSGVNLLTTIPFDQLSRQDWHIDTFPRSWIE